MTVLRSSRRLRIATAVLMAAGIAAAADQKTLQINVIEGEGAFNDIRHHQARPPVVEIRDDENRVVQGARVVFQLPDMGAGGTFADGSHTLVANTDAQGRAAAPGLRPNNVEGTFLIKVTASKDGRIGNAEIRESNTLAGGEQTASSGGHTKLKILIAIAGAAGGVAVAALRSGGGSSNSGGATGSVPMTTLTAGTVTVGGPR